MKNLLTLLFLLSAFTSNAQRTMFGRNNNYVAPVGPPSLVSAGLNGRAFQGKIAFVLFYDKILTAAEQLQNYNALKSRFGL